MNIQISVITPTRNRAQTLHRVFNSLKKQTYKKFEWIVCDDASKDNTLELLKKYKKKAEFNIRIFSFKNRAGKPKIDNFCLKKANGKFIVFADSDDGFKENSFKDFVSEWRRIPFSIKKKTFAIVSRCLKPDNKPLEPKLNLGFKSISYTNLIYNLKKNTEKWLFINKKILKKYRFSEIDYYVPEGILWTKISRKYNLWVLDKCYRIFYSDTYNSITHSNKINYPIGQLEAIRFFIKNNFFIKDKNSYLLLVNFYRFKFINKIYFNYKENKKFKINNKINIIPKILGFCLFIKDIIFFNIENDKFYKNMKQPKKIK